MCTMIFDDAKEKNKHAVATPEDQNTLHSLKIPRLPLSTRRVLTLSNANRQKSLIKNNFVLFHRGIGRKCFIRVVQKFNILIEIIAINCLKR